MEIKFTSFHGWHSSDTGSKKKRKKENQKDESAER
jgi:hypothetical protein